VGFLAVDLGMAKKKPSATKKTRAPKSPRRKKPARRAAARKRPAPKKPRSAKKRARKKSAATAKGAARKRPAAKRRAKSPSRKKPLPRSRPYLEEDEETLSADFDLMEPPTERGLGLESGGQSGDTEGLSRSEIAASESVEELLEEGQAFEAGVISGVENAPDADEGGVRTREVPEDDVPQEYLDPD
jgi:hypothetical protein